MLLFALCCVGFCQAQSTTWSLKNGTAIEGKVLRLSPAGDAVLQTTTGISNVPLHDFDKESVQRLERQFAGHDLSKLLRAAKAAEARQPRSSSNWQGWHALTPEEKRGLLLICAGTAVGVIAWILLLVAAFKENPVWGIAILLFGAAGLIFFILHFNKAKLAFLLHVIAIAMAGFGLWTFLEAAAVAGR